MAIDICMISDVPSKHYSEFALENIVVCGNSVELIKSVPDESVHLILSDIPYGIGAEDWDVLHCKYP